MADNPILDLTTDKYLFFKNTVPEILLKIDGNELPIWGLMSAQHMIEHLILPLKIGKRELDFGILTPLDKLPKQKAFLMSPLGLPKNFPFPGYAEGYIPPFVYKDLQEAKKNLLIEISKFMEFISEEKNQKGNHPFFGSLDKEEWILFQYKHFVHHFMQFGIL